VLRPQVADGGLARFCTLRQSGGISGFPAARRVATTSSARGTAARASRRRPAAAARDAWPGSQGRPVIGDGSMTSARLRGPQSRGAPQAGPGRRASTTTRCDLPERRRALLVSEPRAHRPPADADARRVREVHRSLPGVGEQAAKLPSASRSRSRRSSCPDCSSRNSVSGMSVRFPARVEEPHRDLPQRPGTVQEAGPGARDHQKGKGYPPASATRRATTGSGRSTRPPAR